MPEHSIYLDHNATTPVRPEVIAAMNEVAGDPAVQNPSSVHLPGRMAKRAMKAARATIAAGIGAKPAEIIFTGGGSEAINLAIKGVYFCDDSVKRHVITTKIEHPAVLRTCEWLESRGARVTYLPVDVWGVVSPADVEAAITDDTALISVMHANNEVGTIEPIAAIGGIARAHGVAFHVDAVQSVGKIPVAVEALNCDPNDILMNATGPVIGSNTGPGTVGLFYYPAE